MFQNTNTKVETRPQAGQQAIETALTIDWSDMTAEDVQALAQQALIVKLQSKWRKEGIPNGDCTVKAADYKVGVRAPKTKQSLEQMLAALSPAERAALVAKFAA